MSRLIIISNRLPFSIEKKGEGRILRQSSGGLVSAIKSFLEHPSSKDDNLNENVWVGSADFSPQDWEAIPPLESGLKVEPIFPDTELYGKYYDGFSNSTLWPLFHYFPSTAEYKKDTFDAYTQVNALFAEKVLSIIQNDDIIWIHDYQLMLLPQMIRKERPDATIGFFLHIPFPSYEIYRLLPREWKAALLQGTLGADLVGFHTPDYVQHFIQSCKMVLGLENYFNLLTYNNRVVKADLFPIGIDYEKFSKASSDPEVTALRNEIKTNYSEKKIIFSVDRLDYSKGFMYRLNGFEDFLENNPEWIGKVVFILNVVPSRDTIPAYNEKKKQLEERISELNGKFSTLNWQPIIYRYNHLSFNELMASYTAADVALITPLRDGMNLVAKEYIASCTTQHGVLVLSELTGAASELNEALLVNPTDSREVANAIDRALKMEPAEQQERMELMQQRLKDYDVIRWVNDFLEQLRGVKSEQEKLSVKLLEADILKDVLKQYSIAKKRAILLDYDGTLTPLMRVPALATPSDQALAMLERLGEDPRNEVVIISGRESDILERWLGHLPLNFVAEHGAFIKLKNGSWEEQSTMVTTWKEQIKPILQLFVTRCAGSFIEEKKNTLTWHYRNTHPDFGFIRSRELLNTLLQLTNNTSLQVIDGNKVLEVRQAGMDKGVTALRMVNLFQPDFVLCIGDDTTDEDMFKALEQKAVTIKIGRGATAAMYSLRSQRDVIPLLNQFVNLKIPQNNVHTQV